MVQAVLLPLHPDSASWLNAVEGFLRQADPATAQAGVFKGIVDLQAAINRYLAETNADPKPFTWTADPDAIIKKVRRGKQALESIHLAFALRSPVDEVSKELEFGHGRRLLSVFAAHS